jgi:hypothetical protein
LHKNIRGENMPWCPKCNAEYIDGFTKCHDCGVELVEEPIDKNKESKGKRQWEPITNYNEKVLLVTVDEVTEYSYIRSMLECEGIAHWILDQKVDHCYTRVGGMNSFPKYIYVLEDDIETAKEIVESYTSEESIEDNKWENECYDELEDDDKFYYSLKWLCNFNPRLIYLIIGVGFIACLLVFNLISIIN